LRNGQAECVYIYVLAHYFLMEEESSSSVKINVLSVIGATLALVSLLLPWFSGSTFGYPFGGDRTSYYGLMASPYSFYGPLSLVLVLFLIGTLVAFASPAGGFLQISGIIVYFTEIGNLWSRSITSMHGSFLVTTRPQLGALVGVLATAIVLASLYLPVWLDFRPKKLSASHFVSLIPNASWSRSHEKAVEETASGPMTFALNNSMCLAGAFLGVLCLALPWIQSRGGGSLAAPLGDFITGAQNLVDSPAMVIGAFCFLLGSLLAMVSVAGGLLQLVGIADFLMGTLSLGHVEFYSWQGTFVLGAGFYLGITSIALVAFSLVMQSLLHRMEKGRFLGSAHWIWGRVKPPRAGGPAFDKGTQMNILGFIGALLGVVAIFASWESYYVPSYAHSYVSQVSAFQLTLYGSLDEVTICSAVFIIGTVVALLTPVGGVVQIASAFGFLIFLPHSIDAQPLGIGTSWAYGIGPFLGLLSGLLVLRSLWFPKWLQLRSGLASASSRFFVVSMAPVLGDRSLVSWHRLNVHIPAKHSFFHSARINAACLAGAVSGLVACGLTWSPSASPSDYLESSLLGYARDWGTGAGRADLMFLLFFCGSMIALVSSLGSMLQLAGILGFVYRSGVFHGFSWEGGAAIGFGLAIVSFLLVVGSIFHPWGPGNSQVKHTTATRLLAWGGSTSIANQPPSDGTLN